jgi:hypothetical protein
MEQRVGAGGKKRSRFEDDSTLVFMTTENEILPGFESFEILTKACCPHPGTLLDFRFVHDPQGIALPFALIKIAGGQRGDASLHRLLKLNGRRIQAGYENTSQNSNSVKGVGEGEKGGFSSTKVNNIADVSVTDESRSPLKNETDESISSSSSTTTTTTTAAAAAAAAAAVELILRVCVEEEDALRVKASAAAFSVDSSSSSSSVLNVGQSTTTTTTGVPNNYERENEESNRLIELEIARIQERLLFRSLNSTSNSNNLSSTLGSITSSSSSSSSLPLSADNIPQVSSSITESSIRDAVIRFKQQQQVKAQERELKKKSLFELDVRRIVEAGKRFLNLNQNQQQHHHHQQQQQQHHHQQQHHQQQQQPFLNHQSSSSSMSTSGSHNGSHHHHYPVPPPSSHSMLMPMPNVISQQQQQLPLLSRPLSPFIFRGDTLDRLALPLLLTELNRSLGVGADEEAEVAKQLLGDLRVHKSANALFIDLKDLIDEKEAQILVERLWDTLIRGGEGGGGHQ